METVTQPQAAPQAPQTAQAPALQALPRLTEEQKNDLRKFVLAGGTLTLDQAKQVLESMKSGQAGAVLAAGEKKARKDKKPGLSDAELDAQLDAALKL